MRIEFVADFSGFINPWVGLMHVARILLWRAGMVNKQLERHAYPGQPSTRTRPPVARCECIYWRATISDGRDHIQTLQHLIISVHGLPGVGWFEPVPWCPHHGTTGG